MQMMLTHCSGSVDFSLRRVGLLGQPLIRCDALHALVVNHVALALDVRVFGRVAQLVIRCNAPHALVFDHVALQRPGRAVHRTVGQLGCSSHGSFSMLISSWSTAANPSLLVMTQIEVLVTGLTCRLKEDGRAFSVMHSVNVHSDAFSVMHSVCCV